jgi:hypothetical protein
VLERDDASFLRGARDPDRSIDVAAARSLITIDNCMRARGART